MIYKFIYSNEISGSKKLLRKVKQGKGIESSKYMWDEWSQSLSDELPFNQSPEGSAEATKAMDRKQFPGTGVSWQKPWVGESLAHCHTQEGVTVE